MQDGELTNEQLGELERIVGTMVGQDGIFDVQDRLKRAMLREALVRTRGNYTHAAALLGVRRQAVQQMVQRFELSSWIMAARDLGQATGHDA
jgi:transcriptional regulator of acetoin/glycerol metabolism